MATENNSRIAPSCSEVLNIEVRSYEVKQLKFKLFANIFPSGSFRLTKK